MTWMPCAMSPVPDASRRSPVLVVCMGVSGCGKSTVAAALADRFGFELLEADDYHGEANIARMASGEPLTDAHRGPWMDRLCAALDAELGAGRDCVLAFSGLRHAHRDRVRSLGCPVLYLHLQGSLDVIARRLAGRREHFMPPALLESQFGDLEATGDEADVVTIDVDAPLPDVIRDAGATVDRFLARLTGTSARP